MQTYFLNSDVITPKHGEVVVRFSCGGDEETLREFRKELTRAARRLGEGVMLYTNCVSRWPMWGYRFYIAMECDVFPEEIQVLCVELGKRLRVSSHRIMEHGDSAIYEEPYYKGESGVFTDYD